MKDQRSDVIVKTSVYVSGVKIGDATFTSPALKFKKVDCHSAAGDYEVAYGAVEKLEASAKVNISNPAIYAAISLTNETPIVFAKALQTESGAKGRRDVLVGVVDVVENESKSGEVYELELTMSPHYWLKELAGVPVIEIDKRKDIVRIAGNDLLEDVRNVIGA
jgi:phage tail tube protein FII